MAKTLMIDWWWLAQGHVLTGTISMFCIERNQLAILLKILQSFDAIGETTATPQELSLFSWILVCSKFRLNLRFSKKYLRYIFILEINRFKDMCEREWHKKFKIIWIYQIPDFKLFKRVFERGRNCSPREYALVVSSASFF